MKKKILSVMVAICMFAGVLPVTTYASQQTENINRNITKAAGSEKSIAVNRQTGTNTMVLSTLVSDTNVDDSMVWAAGAELPVGAVIQNDTAFELEIFYVTESVTALPVGVSPKSVPAGGSETIAATGGEVTTTGSWKICGNRLGGSGAEGSVSVKYALVLYPVAMAEYTVTFDANGHGTAPAALTKIVEGSKITEPTAPSATGFTFGGWYKEAGCVNAWDFTKDTVSGNLTLYAKWTEIPADTPAITSITPRGAVYGYGEGAAKATVTTASVSGYTYTYQWYNNMENKNSGGTVLSGATSAEYFLPAGKNAGDYYYYCVATATKEGQSTVLTSNVVTVTIEKKEVALTWGTTEFIYNGASQVPTATVTGLVGTDSCTVSVSGGQINANAEGSTYTATATGLSNQNYKLPANVSTTFKIKKAPMTVEAKDVAYKHDGTSSYGITVTVTKPASGYVIKYGETEGNYSLTTSPVYKEMGSKTVYFQITDSNNNYETYTGSAVVKIADGTAPTGSIVVAGTTYTAFVSSVTFGTPITASQKVTISATDSGSGAGTIYYYVTQTALTSTQVQGSNISWKTYSNPFYLDEDKKYIVYAKLTDQSGNIRYISTNGLVLDGTEPKISGIKDGGEYCKSVTVTVTDTNLSTVEVDSVKKTVSSGKSTFTISGDGKEHTITAVDKAGNETEYTITTNASHSYEDFKQVQSEGEWSLEEAPCKHKCGTKYKRYRKNVDIVAEEDPSGGSIATDVEVRTGAPATSIKGFDTTLAKSLVSDATTKAAQGEDVLVYLDVTRPSTVVSTDKTSTENAVKQYKVQNLKEGMYLDLSLYQKKGSSAATKITKNGLGKNLTISFALPEALKAPAGVTRTYYVVRVHSGTATVLNTTLKDNAITFETDRFSTYSIWYTESGTTVSANSTSSNTTATGTVTAQKDQVPKTGDEDMSFWYGLLCLIGAAGTVYCGWKKILKKRNGE